jgi:hypothetical protein
LLSLNEAQNMAMADGIPQERDRESPFLSCFVLMKRKPTKKTVKSKK